MMTFNRDHTRSIKQQISSYNPHTTFRVEDDRLIVTSPTSLTDEQRALLITHKTELIELLTTPPSEQGQCIRGHAIEWQMTEYGEWVCSCYFAEYVPAVIRPVGNGLRNHWTQAKESDLAYRPLSKVS